MPFPFAAFLICEKKLYIFFLLKLCACLVENSVSKQKPNWGRSKKNKLAKRLHVEVKGKRRNVEMKRTVRVIEVSIYKWTRCPIFYITQSRREKLPEKIEASNVKKKTYILHYVCVYVLWWQAEKSSLKKKTGRKIKWRRSLAIKNPLMQFMDTLRRLI